MLKNVTLTTLLAVYAAIISTVTIILTMTRDLRARGKFKVSAQVRRMALDAEGHTYSVAPDFDLPGASEELFVVMTVVNTGRRPMRWESWGGEYKIPQRKKGWISVPRSLPKMLGEHERHSEYCDLDAIFLGDNIARMYTQDGKGKSWTLSKRQLTALLADAKKFSEDTPHAS